MPKIPAINPLLQAWLLEGPLSAQVPAYIDRLRRGRYATHTSGRCLNGVAHFAHKATSRPRRAARVPRCRVVHGGGRSALATNRPTAAVGNPCATRGAVHAALLTPWCVAAEGVHRLPCLCGDCQVRLPSQGPCETRSPQGAGRPRRAPRCSAMPSKLERLFMSSPPRLPTRAVIPQLQGVCP